MLYYFLFAHRWYEGPKTTLEPVVMEGQVVNYIEEDDKKKVDGSY